MTSGESFARISRAGDLAYTPATERIKTPDKANANYFAGLVLPLKDDAPDYPALVIGNYIFGGGAGLASRLGDRVRQQEGLSYGIASGLHSSPVDSRTTFYIFAIANPDNIEKLRQVIQEELEKLLKLGITPQELVAAKRGFLQELEVERADDTALAGELAESLLAGRTFAFHTKFQDRIQALTVNQVNAALRKHLKPERLVLAIAGDLK